MSIKVRFSVSFVVLSLIVTAMIVAFPGNARAEAAGDSQYRIAVVDMSLLMSEYNKRKEKYDELQKEVDRLQVEIDAMSAKIEKAKEEYESSRANMTDDERFDKRSQIESDFAQYRSELEKRQRLIDTQEERVLKEVVTDIERVITEIAEKEGYHLILNAAKGPRASVLYHSATIDITPRILQDLNK